MAGKQMFWSRHSKKNTAESIVRKNRGFLSRYVVEYISVLKLKPLQSMRRSWQRLGEGSISSATSCPLKNWSASWKHSKWVEPFHHLGWPARTRTVLYTFGDIQGWVVSTLGPFTPQPRQLYCSSGFSLMRNLSCFPPGKASWDRVALPNLRCMLGVLVFL